MKREKTHEFLARGGVTRLYVHPRWCSVPASLRDEECVIFDLTAGTPLDLQTSSYGFSGSFSFSGKTSTCYVPWLAVEAVRHVPTGEHVGAEAAPHTERLAKVIDLAAWRRAHGR